MAKRSTKLNKVLRQEITELKQQLEIITKDKVFPVSSKGTIQNIPNRVLAEEKLNELLLKANISKSINAFALKLFKLNTIEDIIWEIVESIIEKFHFEDCVIYLYDQRKRVFTQSAAYGPKLIGFRKIDNPIILSLGEGVVGSVGQSKKAEIVKDTSKDKRYIQDDINRQSEIAIPIIVKNNIIAVIDSEHSEKNYFTKEHLKTFTIITNLASLRIEYLKTKETQQENLNNFKNIGETTPSPIILINPINGKIIFVNDAFSKLVKIPIKSLIGVEITNLYLNPFTIAKMLMELNRNGSIENKELLFTRGDGSIINIIASMKLLPFMEKQTIFCGFTDVSKLKRAEYKTKDSEFILNRFFNFAPIGISINHMDGKFHKINIEFSLITGYNIEELNKLSYWDLTPKEYFKEEEIQLKHISERKAYGPYEKEYVRKDGSRIPVLLKGIIIQIDGEDFIWSVVEDLSILKKNENKAISIANELQQFIDTSNAPIIGIDIKGNINEWNDKIAQMTQYTKGEMIGTNFYTNIIPKENIRVIKKIFNNALKGKGTSNYELPIYTKDNKRVMIFLNAIPRKNIDGEITGVLGTGQDITEIVGYREKLETKIKERTEKLKIALKNEKELNEMKSRFVSMTSHEFRTPLSTIKFAAGSIKKYWNKFDLDTRNLKLDKIENQVTHMSNLLDDILIIGKAEAGNQESDFELLNFNEFIIPIIEEVQIFNKSTHKVTLLNKNTESTIFIDQKIARNLFINLLNNAIKFSPGKKEVIVEVISKNKMTQIKVIDFGIGIKEEDYETVFQPFSRGKNVDSIQGNGLGLSIVKNAIDISGGEIKFKSIVSKGTIFIINLKNDKQ